MLVEGNPSLATSVRWSWDYVIDPEGNHGSVTLRRKIARLGSCIGFGLEIAYREGDQRFRGIEREASQPVPKVPGRGL